MSEMYKIEYAGPSKEGRALSVLQSLSKEGDLLLRSSDGVTLQYHRCLLTSRSAFVAEILTSLPCCLSPSLSLPFNGTVLKNLLSVISTGVSMSLGRDDLLDVQNAANLLQIKLGNLNVEPSNKVVHLKVDGNETIQDLFHQVTGLPKAARPKVVPRKLKDLLPPPKPEDLVPKGVAVFEQNQDVNTSYDANDIVEVEDREVVEITPEVFEDDDEEGGFAPHFLMEAHYGEGPAETFSPNNSWVEEGGMDFSNKMPELLEFGDGDEKRYKCSFCPNKEFKKRPEVIRHFKKHIPLSQRKRFQCEDCKEKFISNSNLKTHMKVCTGVVKIWSCKRCKAEFDNKTDYEDHLAEAHNTGRKHECSICHKQLRRAGDVRKHMLTHSEGKPFSCDVCGKKFRTESYVKIHRQAHFVNEQSIEIIKRSATMPAAPSEEIHLNGGAISSNGGVEDIADDTEDDGALVIDSNGGSSTEGTGNETESSEGMTTNPGSNEGPPRTPERECYLDQENAVMMNGSFHISPVA